MLRPFTIVTLSILTLSAVGCGDDADNAPTTTADTGTAATDTGTTPADTGTAATDTGTATGDTGTAATDTGTATGDTGTSFNVVQDCAEADFPATAATTEQTISPWNTTIGKKCLKIKAGTKVTWTTPADFVNHPLIPGGGTTPTPIVRTPSGTTVSFTFANAGNYGFRCEIHASMKGSIWVVP